MDDETLYNHESYGMLQISRVECSGVPLFGSSVKHNHLIALRVSRAEKARHLHQDWFHSKEQLIEIYLSPLQFIDAMTNMNTMGVPCTLRYANGKYMAECPEETKREEFQNEIRDDFKNVANGVKTLQAEANQILNGRGNMSAAERNRLSGILFKMVQHIESNMPFVGEQFQKQLNKSIVEAKSEVAAFFDHEIHRLGVDALKDKYRSPEMIGYDEKAD